ncbi:MAG: protein-glutamate O-methyltransferase family protein [Symploca sp. SIO2G7]|nr:protein-glutamate O-methyltransferase family protein [Symploca sp. SIO2G7]
MTNNIPAPLLVSEENSFAYYTFTNRLPVIIEQVIAANNFAPAILEKLNKLKEGLLVELVYPIDDQGPDITDWTNYLQPFLGKPLIELPFYFAEVYLYRRLLAITEYFTSPTGEQIDPFEKQKRQGLETAITSIRQVSIKLDNLYYTSADRNKQWQQGLRHLLYLNLWGNRMDLSFAPKEASKLEQQELDLNQKQSQIILDDTALIVDQISSFKNNRIDFIVDNSGFELVSDLFVIDFLLASNAAAVVYLHLKSHPIFVSDAMIKDVRFTLDFLANDKESTVKDLGIRLQSYLASGRLILTDHFFWTAPLFFWNLPDSLKQELSQSDLVFIKGDANYRRLVGDLHWPKNSNFNNIVSYFPSAFTVLRTTKSEVIVGLQQYQIDDLNHQDSQWLTNGKWGLIQFRC